MEKFINYGTRHYMDMLGYLLEHIQMCTTAICIALIIAIPLCVFLLKRKKLSKIVWQY